MDDRSPLGPYHIESGVPGNYAVYDERTGECVYRTNTWERAVAHVRHLERRDERPEAD